MDGYRMASDLPSEVQSHLGNKPTILYFVVSHPSCVKEEVAARTTWSTGLNIRWFNTEKLFRDTIVVSVAPNTYMNVFPRVREVWKHVYLNEGDKYDWYVRLFPDNYLFPSRLESFLQSFDPTLPQLIGHVASTNHGPFVGGGAGWVVSRSALEAWASSDGDDFSKCAVPEWLAPDMAYAEDVIISDCMQRAGVKFLQHKDVFRSFYPGHESNSDITEGEILRGKPKKLITLHYMQARQTIDLWSKEIRGRKYAVMSFTDDQQGLNYAYMIPYAVAAWKRIGWSAIIVQVRTRVPAVPFLQGIQDSVLSINPTALYLTIDGTRGSAVTVAQLIRLFVSSLEYLNDDDLLLTTDADILPISEKVFEFDASNSINILNADCCGSIKVASREVLMQPMTNIIASTRHWRTLMNIRTVSNLNEFDVEKWLRKHGFGGLPSAVAKGENEEWYLDQRIVSLQLELSRVPIKKMPRNTNNDRVDRIYPYTWPTRLTSAALHSKTDLHAWLPSYRGNGHHELMYFIQELFHRFDIAVLQDFHSNFTLDLNQPDNSVAAHILGTSHTEGRHTMKQLR